MRGGAITENTEVDEIHTVVSRRLRTTEVIPVLGAGANLCGRPKDVKFEPGRYLPSGLELATYLAQYVQYPENEPLDLPRVSQYIACTEGAGPLYNQLRDVFNKPYPPTALHRFLADLAQDVSREQVQSEHHDGMLFVTTNYDTALEQAFDRIQQPYDVLTYIAEGRNQGLFRHSSLGGSPIVITRPNEYMEIDLHKRPLIAKIHGAVTPRATSDSYVITEDNYVDYISRGEEDFFPVTVAEKLANSHFLFLGYSLRDWNFRVMLHRLWTIQEGRNWKSWAIEANPDPVDRAAWKQRGVEIVPERLEDFVVTMRHRFGFADEDDLLRASI